MPYRLPIFPLGTVLFPGLLLPLHIFEDRYRHLVRDLVQQPEPRRFGVIAIREGRETGIDGVSALYEIGCTATLRRVTERDDGRFDLVTIGAERFRLTELDDSKPYLQGDVEILPEDTGEKTAAGVAVEAVQRAFRGYVNALNARGATQVSIPELPDDPLALSYLVAASIIADLHDRQALLAEPDALRRLIAERTLLSRETSMLRSLTSTPAPEFRYAPYSPN
jgi:uncharacterized protein